MLSMLFAARDEDGSQLTDDEIIGHAGVIFAAGHETSANALTWTLFCYPSIPRSQVVSWRNSPRSCMAIRRRRSSSPGSPFWMR